ncbi:MAG: hypothetical protein ACLFPX_08180 [Candidatus Omnitrophota bacterium]
MRKKTFFSKILCGFLSILFLFGQISGLNPDAFAQNPPILPAPGAMVAPTLSYVPAIMKGIRLNPDDPLKIDFIVDTGNSDLPPEGFQEESLRQIRYFLTALTVPSGDLWVNLSPAEKDRIIPRQFSLTEMGRDLLSQDYLLKQLSASLLYPEHEPGKTFWQKIRARITEKYGRVDIPAETFNKIWIVPARAVVYEHGNAAFVVRSHMDVMLEEDYLLTKPQGHKVSGLSAENGDDGQISQLQTEVMREVVLPAIAEEVNTGEQFSRLRQVYHALIMAAWFRQKIRDSILGRHYVGQNKVAGVNTVGRLVKDRIYQQYVEAFQKGVYSYVREEVDPSTGQIIPRKYFSGGMSFDGTQIDEAMLIVPASAEKFMDQARSSTAGTLQTVRSQADPVEQASGLIGKWQVQGDIAVDEEDGLIRFEAREIGSGREEYIELKIKDRLPAEEALLKMASLSGHYDLVDQIIDWCRDNLQTVMVLENNEYGIHGLGTSGVVAVEERFQEDGLAWFHEAGEAMIAAGALSFENIEDELSNISREWFIQHVRGRQQTRLYAHYALRALTRQLFEQKDLELTYAVKGRLTLEEARAYARSRNTDNIGQVLRSFRERRAWVTSAAEERELIDRIAEEIREEDKIKPGQPDARTGEGEEQTTQGTHEQVLQLLSIAYHIDAFAGDSAGKMAQALRPLSGFDQEGVRDAVFDFFISRERRGVGKEIDEIRQMRVMRALSDIVPDVVLGIMERGLREMRSLPLSSYERSLKIFEFLYSSSPHGPRDEAGIQKIHAQIMEGVREQKARPHVTRSFVEHLGQAASFLVPDSFDPQILYFPEDFSTRITQLRDENAIAHLKRIYFRAGQQHNFLLRFFAKFWADALSASRADRVEYQKTTAILQRLLDADLKVIEEEDISIAGKIYFISMLSYLPSEVLSPLLPRLTAVVRQAGAKADAGKSREVLARSLKMIVGKTGQARQDMIMALEDAVRDILKKDFDALAKNDQEMKSLSRMLGDAKQRSQDSEYSEVLIQNFLQRRGELAHERVVLQSEIDSWLELAQSLIMRMGFQVRDGDLLDMMHDILLSDDLVSGRALIISALRDAVSQRHAGVIDMFLDAQGLTAGTPLHDKIMRLIDVDEGDYQDILKILSDKNIPEKTAYLLLLARSDDGALMRKAAMERQVPYAQRLYAFQMYVRHFPTRFSDEQEALSAQKELMEVLDAFSDKIDEFLAQAASDGEHLKDIFESPMLRDDMIQTYCFAFLLAAVKETSIFTPGDFVSIAKKISGARILDYFSNADEDFRLGAPFFRQHKYLPSFFAQVVLHEIMHVYMLHRNYTPRDLAAGIVHEMMSDLLAIVVTEKMGVSRDAFLAALVYDDQYQTVMDHERRIFEVHEGARAQLKVIFDKVLPAAEIGELEKILDAGVYLLFELQQRPASLSEFLAGVFRISTGDSQRPSSVENQEGESSSAEEETVLSLVLDVDFDPQFRPEEFVDTLVDPETLSVQVSAGMSGLSGQDETPDTVGGIDFDLDLVEIESVSSGDPVPDMPVGQILQNGEFQGIRPVILQILPTSLPFFIGKTGQEDPGPEISEVRQAQREINS